MRSDPGTVLGDADPWTPADMVAVGREALEQWRRAGSGTAAERRAAQRLAFAFGRLDALRCLEGPAADQLSRHVPAVSDVPASGRADRVQVSERPAWDGRKGSGPV